MTEKDRSLIAALLAGRKYWEMAPDQNLTIVCYDNLESLERLRPEWDALLSHYPFSTIFSTYEWLVPWWHAFGNTTGLLVLAFRDAASELVGLAPLVVVLRRKGPLSFRILRLMGDGSHDSDNLDLPVRPGYERAFSLALLHWLQKKANLWDICELNTLPSDSIMGRRLLDELTKREWRMFTSTRPQTVIEFPESWEAYLKGISAKERGKIGLRTRRLEKKCEVRIRRCSEEAEIDPLLLALFELHGKHWQLRGLPGTLHWPPRQRFYRELAGLLLARKRLDFWVLEVNQRVVAAQFGLRYGTTVFSLQEGFDPAYATDSVGYVLRSHVLKQIVSEGIRRYDFLSGSDESKVRWGGKRSNYFNLHFAQPLSQGSGYLSLTVTGRQAKHWLRDHLPTRMWKVLKALLGKRGT